MLQREVSVSERDLWFGAMVLIAGGTLVVWVIAWWRGRGRD